MIDPRQMLSQLAMSGQLDQVLQQAQARRPAFGAMPISAQMPLQGAAGGVPGGFMPQLPPQSMAPMMNPMMGGAPPAQGPGTGTNPRDMMAYMQTLERMRQPQMGRFMPQTAMSAVGRNPSLSPFQMQGMQQAAPTMGQRMGRNMGMPKATP